MAEDKKGSKKKGGKKIIIVRKRGGHGGAHGGSWKVAYADFVTAMMAFFLLMWLVSALDPEQKEQISRYFTDGVAQTPSKDSQKIQIARMDKAGVPDIKLARNEKLTYSVIKKLKEFIASDNELKQSAEAATDGKGVVLYVGNGFLYQQGTAVLTPRALDVLAYVVRILKEYNFDLVIRGHTDDIEHPSNLFPSNWELSAARAAACLRWLLKNSDIPATRLRAMGYADTRPLVPNASAENRARNRRVEFYFHLPDEQVW